jgi:peptidoglycan/xylan/chitin deacetylase (PgdA/CDA1 family)
MSLFKDVAKTVALRTGAFSLLHRLRNRECLTVLMFHRVLPAELAGRFCADPEYAVTPELLGNILAFCKRHYSPVGLEDVLASREGIRPLPSYPVLVTFDDGWRDNLDYAHPVLQAAGVPWVLFAATDAVAAPAIWWQEVLEWALRSGRASYDELWLAASGDRTSNTTSARALALLLRFGALPPQRRDKILEPYAASLRDIYGSNIALSSEDLRLLRHDSVGIGAHGSSHMPLSLVDHVERDLAAAREWLTANVDVTTEYSISFPHGRYDNHTARIARDTGYRLLFTSDPVLNPCPKGWLKSDIVGRISIATANVEGANGNMKGERLAPWLFLRERSVLAA